MKVEENTSSQGGENIQQEAVDLGTFKSVKTLKEAYDNLRKTFTQNAMELAKLKKQNSIDTKIDDTKTNEINSKPNENSVKTVKIQENNENFRDLDGENTNSTTIQAENTENNSKIPEQNTNNTQNLLQNLENNALFDKTTENIIDKNNESDKVDSTPDTTITDADKVKSPAERNFESAEWQNEVHKFFLENEDARQYAKEIGNEIMQDKAIQQSIDPLARAWIRILKKQNERNRVSDTDLEEIAVKNENIKQKVILEYLSQLRKKGTPRLISKPSSELNASLSPRALNMDDAKELARKIMMK